MLSPQPSSNPSLSLAQPLRSERSGRDTPASVDSIPLEWDHDYDLSRDLESAVSRTLPSEDEEGQEDKDFYPRGAVGLSGRKELFLYGSSKENKREWILYGKRVSSAESSSFLSHYGKSLIREQPDICVIIKYKIWCGHGFVPLRLRFLLGDERFAKYWRYTVPFLLKEFTL